MRALLGFFLYLAVLLSLALFVCNGINKRYGYRLPPSRFNPDKPKGKRYE